MTTVCGCFCGSTPEPVPVTVNNNTYNVSLGTATGLKWVDLSFELEDTTGGNKVDLTAVVGGVTENYTVVAGEEILVTLDNVPQANTTYVLDASRTYLTLNYYLTEGSILRVRALVTTATA